MRLLVDRPFRLSLLNLLSRRSNDTLRSSAGAIIDVLHTTRAASQELRMTAEHRDLLELIRMEYLEMPDLCLTMGQARRLWNLQPSVCDELMTELVREGFLSKVRGGSFLRRVNDTPNSWASPPSNFTKM